MEKLGFLDHQGLANQETFIRPSHGWVAINLAKVWKWRSLLYFLVWRDIRVRYKQTILGALWVVLQPVLVMVMFSIIFGVLAEIPSDGIPYPLFVFCALVPWQLVANAFSDAGNSLAANQNLITKVYFPRLIIPLAAVLTRLVDFTFAVAVLVGMIVYYELPLGHAIWLLPFFIGMAIAIGLGVGLWIASLSLRYRDVRQMTPFFTQLWFYASPITYSATLIPDGWRFLYGINPMVGVIDGFRWTLTGAGTAPGPNLILPLLGTAFLLTSGLYFFRRMERVIADVV